MIEKELLALQPTEQTGPAIRAALALIASSKASARSRARDAQSELDEKMQAGTLTSAHRRKLEDLRHDQLQAGVMLDALAAEVEQPLSKIETAERNERLGAEVIALEAEKKALEEKWLAEYPALHTALKALLSERDDFASRALGKGFDLADFEIPSQEIRLLKTPKQRAFDATPHWLHESRALAARIKAENAAAAARGPRVVNDVPPQPTLTVGGVLQAMPGRGW